VAHSVERNTLLSSLAAFCESHPVDEKILLVPSMAAGVQMLDALARSACAHINLRPETVVSLALAGAGPELASEGCRLLSRAQLLALVEGACDEVLEETSYFGKLRARVGLHRAIQRTLEELRRAGLGPRALRTEAFEDPRKGRELAEILRAYEAALVHAGATDTADVLRRGALVCREGRAPRLPENAFLLRPAGLDLAPLEEEFVAAFADAPVILPEDPADGHSHAGLLFASALGEENEIRGALRRVLDEGLPWDAMELVFDDDATYRPLILEIATAYGVPCTFSDGIPATYTRPGQGILDYLEWVGEDFPSSALERLLADGRANLDAFRQEGSRAGGVRLSRALRRLRIVAGAPRWMPRLDALVRREEQLPPDSPDDPAGEAARRDRLAAATTLRRFVGRLFELTPRAEDGRVSLPALASACASVVREALARRSDLDGAAARALADLFEQLAALPERTLSPAEAARRLREAVRALSVESSPAAPGHLHVSRLERGGWAGRPLTIVLGLDESRFPGPPRQDPVLLDAERAALSPRLPRPGESRARERRQALLSLLGRARGRIVASFTNRDILLDAERFPSPVLLELFRLRENRLAASYGDLLASLPPAASFVPSGEPLDETEWWLARLRENAGAEGLEDEVGRAYPWLADGARAGAERDSEAFTPWDGRVGGPPGAFDPRATGEPVSASRLERLAKCPRAYFFEFVLGLAAPEEDRPEDAWLNAKEFGNLLHEILHDLLSTLRAEGLHLDPARHEERLQRLTKRHLARWREIVPPPNDAAFRVQEREVFDACRIFLSSEARENAGALPRYFEVPFGLARGNASEPLGSKEPIEIGVGRSRFLLRGQIDRIDETAPGTFAVWDYKSGSDFSYAEDDLRRDPLHGGRVLQHALYARAAATLLARAGEAPVRVASGYFFLTRKGKGRRVLLEPKPQAVDRTLGALFSLLSSGSFPHTTDPHDCRFCPYRSICGDVDNAAGQAARKRKSPNRDRLLVPLDALGDGGGA
jgi:ATP-dependent helicase/nuclease subunit B